jgi:hypothetical protein
VVLACAKIFRDVTLLTFWFPTAELTPCDARELVYRLEALKAG